MKRETPADPCVFVNDQPRALPEPPTLEALLASLGLEARNGVAAAVGGEVVPRGAWPRRTLVPGDRVLVVRATQGG
jgi:sulfur carrier protein